METNNIINATEDGCGALNPKKVWPNPVKGRNIARPAVNIPKSKRLVAGRFAFQNGWLVLIEKIREHSVKALAVNQRVCSPASPAPLNNPKNIKSNIELIRPRITISLMVLLS